MRAAGATGAAQARSFVPVPPSSVHKHNAENVWIAGAESLPDDRIRLAYRTPENATGARLAELVEVERQAGIYFVHAHFGVPEGHVFILSSISIRRTVDDPAEAASDSVGAVIVQENRTPSPPRAETELVFRLASKAGSATGAARVRFLPARVYERMRALRGPAAPGTVVPAGEAGSDAAARYEGIIETDPADPVLSDHEADHISAMTVIVSIERGLLDAGAQRVDAISTEFHAYLEHDPRPTYAVTLSSDGAFTGSVRQNGVRRATVTGQALLSGTGDQR